MTIPSGWDPTWETIWNQETPDPTNKAYRDWILNGNLINDPTVYIPLSPIGYSANSPWYDRVVQHNIEYLYANLGGGSGTAPPFDPTYLEQKDQQQDDRLDALEAAPSAPPYDDQWIKDELAAVDESISSLDRSTHVRLYDIVGGTGVGASVGPGEIWLGPNGDTGWNKATEMRIHSVSKNSEFVVELLGPGDFVHIEYTDTKLAVETYSGTFVVTESPKLDLGTGTFYQFAIEPIHVVEGDPNLANHVGHEVAFSWTLAPALKSNWLENASRTWRYGDIQALKEGEFGFNHGAVDWAGVNEVAIHDDALNGVRHAVSQLVADPNKPTPIKATIAIEATTIKGDQTVFYAQVTSIAACADAWGNTGNATKFAVTDKVYDDSNFPVAGDKLHIHIAGLI